MEHPQHERPDVAYRAGAAALLVASAVLLFFDFGWRVLDTNDEARFPMLARDILRHGEWLVPRIGGLPHLNKPPLLAWLIALGAWPFGDVTQRTALAPSLLAGVGAVMLTAWIGRRLWTPAVGLTAGFLVLTMHGVFTMARAPMPDMLLCLTFTGAMAALVAADRGGRRSLWAVFYVLVALGFWVKGPAAFIALAILIVFVGGTAGRRGLGRAGLAWGAALVVAMILPWFLLASDRGGGDFVHGVVLTDWLLWYAPEHWGWRTLTEPVAQTLTIVLPWAPLLPLALVSALRADGDAERRKSALLLTWVAAVFVLVGLSDQQRMRYYLPLCPPVALLVAAWYERLSIPYRRRVAVAAACVTIAALLLWQGGADRRHNAGTDLRALATLDGRLPVYAVKVPELTLDFYTRRPVTALLREPGLPVFPLPGAGYFVVTEHFLQEWLAQHPMPAIASGSIHGRRFAVLRLDPVAAPR